jgi:hypothetical protein
LTTEIGEAAEAGVVSSVSYTPGANVTGADTDSRTVSLINKGADGNGTTVIATLDFVEGVDAADFDETAIPLSETPADLEVAAGNILAWVSAHVGSTGLADPGGLVQVEIGRS